MTIQMATLALNQTVTGVGSSSASNNPIRSFQATILGTGAVSATVGIYVSNAPVPISTDWTFFGTITLSGTTSDSDILPCTVPYAHNRSDVSAISGTGAAVSVYMAS